MRNACVKTFDSLTKFVILILGKIGKIVLELGHIETYILRCSRSQNLLDVSYLPDQEGTTLYKLLTDPDNVNLDHFSFDIFVVSKY